MASLIPRILGAVQGKGLSVEWSLRLRFRNGNDMSRERRRWLSCLEEAEQEGVCSFMEPRKWGQRKGDLSIPPVAAGQSIGSTTVNTQGPFLGGPEECC